MSQKWIPAVMVAALLALAIGGCAPHQVAGGTTGAYMGGIAGALLDSRNPWRGGVVGAALGAIAGATIADISVQGAREAAYAQQPVEYRTDDQRVRYYAEPLGYDEAKHCRRVREYTYVDGELVRKKNLLICDRGQVERPAYRYNPYYQRYERDDD